MKTHGSKPILRRSVKGEGDIESSVATPNETRATKLMIAKTGDVVVFKHKFKIVSYSLERETIFIEYFNTEGYVIGQEYVPLYLGELCILQKELAFVVPGDHNEIGHPDYYPITQVSDRGKRVIYKDRPHQLRLDPEFRYNGKYSLVNEDTGVVFLMKARKTTNKFIEDILKGTDNHILNGNLIKGVIVTLYYVNEVKNIMFVSSMDIATSNTIGGSKAGVIIRDLYSNIEYDLPVNLITLG